jgi:hypothetical protein
MAERDGAGHEGYGDWRQARFDRFLSRVFAKGERSEWLLKGGMSMLARVPALAHHQRRGPRGLARFRSR